MTTKTPPPDPTRALGALGRRAAERGRGFRDLSPQERGRRWSTSVIITNRLVAAAKGEAPVEHEAVGDSDHSSPGAVLGRAPMADRERGFERLDRIIPRVLAELLGPGAWPSDDDGSEPAVAGGKEDS